jgi:hypothetical protein
MGDVVRYVELFVACLEAVGGKPSREQLRFDVAFGIAAFERYRSKGGSSIGNGSSTVNNGTGLPITGTGVSGPAGCVGGTPGGVVGGSNGLSTGTGGGTQPWGCGDSGVVEVSRKTRRNRVWRQKKKAKQLQQCAEEFASTHSDSELSASWKERKLLENKLASMTLAKKLDSISNPSNVSRSSVSPSSSASQHVKGMVSQGKYDSLLRAYMENEKKLKKANSEYKNLYASYKRSKDKKISESCEEPAEYTHNPFYSW